MPGTGSDGAGLGWCRGLGHTVHPTYPALTPLTAEPPRHAALAGVSLRGDDHGARPGQGGSRRAAASSSPTAATAARRCSTSPTWRCGRASPAAASRCSCSGRISTPAAWDRRLRRDGHGGGPAPPRSCRTGWPNALLAEAGVDAARPLPQLRREERRRLVELLARYPLPWTGDEGYRKAEVTGGGVALAEVDPRTLESRRHPGLFLCGEILDAFGPIGGHNFAWAWATGRAAGLGAARFDVAKRKV